MKPEGPFIASERVEYITAVKKAKEFLAERRMKPEDFRNEYNAEEVDRDIREVSRVKEKDEYKNQDRSTSSVMEAIFLKKAKTCYGKYGVSVKASSEYDDFNGTDAVLQFGDDAFLSVDLTTEKSSHEKFEKILREKTAEAKYFDPGTGRKEMPRAVLYFPANGIKKFGNAWAEDGEPKLDDHQIFVDFMIQAYVELLVILNHLGEKGLTPEEKKIKALYEKTLKAIEPIWDDFRAKRLKENGKDIGEHVLRDLKEMEHAGVFMSEEERMGYLRKLAA